MIKIEENVLEVKTNTALPAPRWQYDDVAVREVTMKDKMKFNKGTIKVDDLPTLPYKRLTIKFEHNPLFTVGQRVSTPSGIYEFVEALPQGNVYTNIFKNIDNDKLIELHDDKFGSWYYNNFLNIALDSKEDGSLYTAYNNQVVYINGVKHYVVGLFQMLKDKLYTDVTDKSRQKDLVNAIVKLFMQERFFNPTSEDTVRLTHKYLVSDWLQHKQNPPKRKSEFSNGAVKPARQGCHGCQALVFYREQDNNHGVAQAESQKFQSPYYCAYTGKAPSPEKVHFLRDETGRGEEGVHFDNIVDGCGHYVPNSINYQYTDKSGKTKTGYKPFHTPIHKYHINKDGSVIYRIPGIELVVQ